MPFSARCLRLAAPCLLLAASSFLFAQQRVDPRNMHERLLCVVPITGTGTPADPRRPMHAPPPPAKGAVPSRDGIIAFTWQPSDDGRLALVEFVARDRAAFDAILKDSNPEVKVFEKGKAKRADIEKEFKRHKKDFDLDRFGVVVP